MTAFVAGKAGRLGLPVSTIVWWVSSASMALGRMGKTEGSKAGRGRYRIFYGLAGAAIVTFLGVVIYSVLNPAKNIDLLKLGAVLLAAIIVLSVVLPSPINLSRFAFGSFEVAFDRQVDRIEEEIKANPIGEDIGGGGGTLDQESLRNDPKNRAQAAAMEAQENILRRIYLDGLAQARLSFFVSLVFAVLGGLLLLGGVLFALIHAPDQSGWSYASIVSVSAGVVTNLLSSVFFVQSNRARKDLAAQGTMLRDESQEDRRLSAARDLATAISDDKLRDYVRAELATNVLLLSENGEWRSAASVKQAAKIPARRQVTRGRGRQGNGSKETTKAANEMEVDT